jgi:hypothetical protein
MAAPQTSWIWQDEMTGGTMGAVVDLDNSRIDWIDQPGCACGDSMHTQTIEDFLQHGARNFPVPADVEAEMKVALTEQVRL